MKMFQWERITRGDNTDYMWRLKILVLSWCRVYLFLHHMVHILLLYVFLLSRLSDSFS